MNIQRKLIAIFLCSWRGHDVRNTVSVYKKDGTILHSYGCWNCGKPEFQALSSSPSVTPQ